MNLKKVQKKVFQSSEGDEWYKRNYFNKKQKIGESTKLLSSWLKPFKKDINSIFEIGCSDARVLAYLVKSLNSKGYGVDPSQKAINDGKKKFKKSNIKLLKGTSDKLFASDQSIDLVHFGFCLVWVDRNDYFKSISEADRICKPGGFISILDFDSPFNEKVKYHHQKNILTYKTDNTSLFLANGHYSSVNTYSLTNNFFHFDKNYKNRVKISLIYKEKDSYLSI